MHDIVADVRLALRALRRSPLFSSVVLLTLALGIGANTAVFSLVDTVILRPLPFDQPERVVSLWMERADGDGADSFSAPDYRDVVGDGGSFESLGYWIWWGYDVGDGDAVVNVPSARVSPGLFDLLGVEPVHGRDFSPEEGAPGADRVVLLNHALWRGRYGGDPGLVGRQIRLDDEPYTVVGVMPDGFRFPLDEYGRGFWVPMGDEQLGDSRRSRGLNVVARLADGAGPERARTELQALAARLAEQYPESNAGWSMNLLPVPEAVVGEDTRTALWVLYGVVAVILLLACANLANLMLARAESRRRETAVRAALGADRGRLAAHWLGESLLLSVGGGVLGLLLTAWVLDLFVAALPVDLPRLEDIRLDSRVLGFALALSLATGVLFGLLPACQASRHRIFEALQAGGAARVGGAGRRRFRAGLVVVEVAAALALLVGAGLLTRSFATLLGEELGFDSERTLVFEVSPRGDLYRRLSFYEEMIAGLGELPGLELVGGNTAPPLSGTEWATRLAIAGRPEPAPGEEPAAQFNVVTPDYFRVLGIPLRSGRFFDSSDRRDRRPGAVIVNEALARRNWPGQSALGQRLSLSMRFAADAGDYDGPSDYEVVGIVGDVRKFGLDREPVPEVFVPYTQQPPYFLRVVARTSGEPLALADAVRGRLASIDPTVAVQDMTTVDRWLSASIARPRFLTLLIGAFALLALALATLGVYGVVSYAAGERTRELGVRMALGARPADVVGLMLHQGLMPTAAGLALGAVAALGLTRLLSGLLYRVTATDPWTFAAVSLLLAAAALLASWLPARRVSRVDPLAALRSE